MTEKEKMLAGELYDASDPELLAARNRARDLCRDLFLVDTGDKEKERRILSDLLGCETDVAIIPPFHCDYGTNIHLGEKVYFNANCVVLDVLPVTIGDRVLIGPAVQIYTALHPEDAKTRASGLENGKPVSIGDDVWIGGGAIICPGVTIGERSIVGAGSVVTRDVSPDVIVAGNPARVIRGVGKAEA
ncbi:MAG: maltose acetyltransferase [Verrucomicrobiales bacterium]|nr:maltose acetyltransferase [Verrucomicrobiales bacterium]